MDNIVHILYCLHHVARFAQVFICSKMYVIVISRLGGMYPVYSHEHEGAKRPSASDLASFPGLPRFFCSSVSVDNNTRMRKGGEKLHPCIIVNGNRRTEKNGVGLGTRLQVTVNRIHPD